MVYVIVSAVLRYAAYWRVKGRLLACKRLCFAFQYAAYYRRIAKGLIISQLSFYGRMPVVCAAKGCAAS